MGTIGKRTRHGDNEKTPPAKPNGDTNRSLIEIELALARYYSFQRNIIAFNVLGESVTLPLFHECDMLVVTKAGYLTEVEIKRTIADFRAEFKKRHHHTSRVPLENFVYCIPEGILDKAVAKLEEEKVCPSRILTYDEELRFRERAVHAVIDTPDNRESTRLYRESRPDDIILMMQPGGEKVVHIVDPYNSHPLFIEQRLEIARLGAMRQYSLREKILRMEKEKEKDPDTKLLNRITELEVLLYEYRNRYKEETGNTLDEKEILYG